MTGPSTQLAPACRTRAAMTTKNVGQIASASALKQIAATASTATSRAERTASTNAPPGIWQASATSPPVVKISPISNWVQACPVR